MAYIQSAFYGDEKSNKKVTDILRDKVVGTTIDLTVNDQLIPAFEVAEKVTLDDKEDKKIKDDAAKACGGADKACIDRTVERMRQDALAAKQGEVDAAAIKGKRLTINYINESGQPVRKVIPEGQKFKMDNIMIDDPQKGALKVPPPSYFKSQVSIIGTFAIYAVFYVFSVAATYVLFRRTEPGAMLAVPATIIAVFVPFSGYFMILFYFGFFAAVDTYVGKVQ